jgi:hypothetical protein
VIRIGVNAQVAQKVLHDRNPGVVYMRARWAGVRLTASIYPGPRAETAILMWVQLDVRKDTVLPVHDALARMRMFKRSLKSHSAHRAVQVAIIRANCGQNRGLLPLMRSICYHTSLLEFWSRWSGLNRQPTVYKSAANCSSAFVANRIYHIFWAES